MWIRSQYQDILLNADTFILQYTINARAEQYWNIFSNGYELGKYSTESKAMKVLNIIQNKIIHNYAFYQMPEDDEVKDDENKRILENYI